MLLETDRDRDRPGASAAAALCTFAGTRGKSPEQEGPREQTARDTWEEGAQRTECREGKKV